MPPSAATRNHDERTQLGWLAACLAVLAWLIPDHYPPWGSFYNEFAAFAALWFLLLYYTLGAACKIIELPRWHLLLPALAAIPLLQAALGHIYFVGDAVMAAAYILGFAIACTLGYRLARQQESPGMATGLACVLLLGAVLSALLVIYQWLELDFLQFWVEPVPRYGRPYANLGQPNQLATLLCLGIAALIYLSQARHVPPGITWLLVPLLILGLVLTQARTPWIAGLLLIGWWFAKRRSVPGINGPALGAGLILYASLIVFWPLDTQTGLAPAVQQRADITEAGTHFQNWQEMFRAVHKEPWWGYGWNQVAVAHVQTAQERHTYSELLTHSHNLFLDLLIWNGLPIGLLLIAGILWWLATQTMRCRTPESWFALLAIGCVGIHAMFEYPLDYAYFLLPVGLLVGLVEADQPARRLFIIPSMALWPVVAAFAFMLGWIWHEYRIVEADYRLMRFEARRIGPLKTDQPAPDLILLTQLREDLRMGRTLAQENMSAEELDWMRRITYRYPWYSSLFRYAVSLALNGRQQEASIEFRRIYDIYQAGPYAQAKQAVRILADSQYPSLKNWQLPPP